MDILYRLFLILGGALIVAGVLKYIGVYHGSDKTPLTLIVVGIIVVVVDLLLFPQRGYYARRRL